MTKKEIVTLIGVISKVKEIAEKYYDNKVYDNILTIFNKLNTREKRVLLKGLINICFVVENKVLVSTDDLMEIKDVIVETKDNISTITNIEQINKTELANQLLKLKMLGVKAVILLLITIILIVLLFLVVEDPGSEIIKTVETVFSFFGKVLW